jgi:hypothetical protein
LFIHLPFPSLVANSALVANFFMATNLFPVANVFPKSLSIGCRATALAAPFVLVLVLVLGFSFLRVSRRLMPDCSGCPNCDEPIERRDE